MANHSIVVDLGLTEYTFCWKLQQGLHEARKRNLIPDCLVLVEHPRVMTFGRGKNRGNLLVSQQVLVDHGIPCVDIERGGDVTYHGPGQLIAYPIFALKNSGIGVLDFVERLEEIMIQMLQTYGIPGRRDPRNRGVWVEGKKIGFVGIAIRKGISFHGLALNVNLDLSPFHMINPCGLHNVAITSMKDLLKTPTPMEPLKEQCISLHEKIFDSSLKKTTLEALIKILAQNDCLQDDAGEKIP